MSPRYEGKPSDPDDWVSVVGRLPDIDDHVYELRLEGSVSVRQRLRIAQMRLVEDVTTMAEA
jgi:hypothetical protein